jgi:type II secretory pathway pseudopilin PulG
MAPRTRAGSRGQRGFTLAGVIVLMTIMMIFVAYTVPRQWSAILQRDREKQTIFVMKQYAIAIDNFAARHGGTLPVSLDQLKDARQPHFVRTKKGVYLDPLTGELDWLIIPASAAGVAGRPAPGGGPAPGAPGPTPGSGPSGQTPATVPGVPMKDYAGGPFIGVRPGKNGESLLEFNGATRYEQWVYTRNDYIADRIARWAAAQRIWQ